MIPIILRYTLREFSSCYAKQVFDIIAVAVHFVRRLTWEIAHSFSSEKGVRTLYL